MTKKKIKDWKDTADIETINKSSENENLSFLSNKAPKKLFGCPPPPAPNFWKWEKKRFLLYKSIPHLIFRIPKKFFFPLRILIF